MHAPSLSFAAAVAIPIVVVVVVVATTGVVWPYTKVRVWKNKKICFCSTNPFTTEKSGFLFFLLLSFISQIKLKHKLNQYNNK